MGMKNKMGVLLLGLIVSNATGCAIGATSGPTQAGSSLDPTAHRNSQLTTTETSWTAPETAANDYEQLGDTYARQRN